MLWWLSCTRLIAINGNVAGDGLDDVQQRFANLGLVAWFHG
jgi:hypothetical protein